MAAALMAKMGMTEAERPRVKLECLRLLASLKLDQARMHLISGFIDTYLRLNAQETLLFKQEADTLLESDEKGQVMEIVTSWMEEGIEKGIQQGLERGRQEGRQEGQLQIILRQLRRLLGLLEPSVEQQVKQLSPDKLETLAEAQLNFKSLHDLEVWLQNQT
jgi:flagellar biosynthesis/type III secretory pathway protein FliH